MKPPIVDKDGFIRPPENPIVLTTGPLVGLGDHAVLTTLPKRFKEAGYTVYLDKDNAARNDEIVQALWKENPYIDGLSDLKPNAGYVRQGLFYEIANRFPIGSIEAAERAHGLPPPYSVAPFIAYQPKKFRFDLSQTVLIDFSAVSSKIGEQGLGEFARAMKGRFIRSDVRSQCEFLQIIPPKFASLHPPQFACPSIEIGGIYEYLDALASCRGWIGSEAGGQSLAAAVRGEHDVYDLEARPEVVVCSTVRTFNSRGYTYRGVDYRVSQFGDDKTSDMFFTLESQVHTYELRCAMSYEQMRSGDPQAWRPLARV